MPPLLKAALAHVQFETIHPFLDGNGRIGRLLILLQLVADGVLREPMLYPSLYFKRHRALYYELLNEVRLRGDWERWLDFFAEGIEASATQAVATANTLLALVNADRDQIARLGRAAPSGSRGASGAAAPAHRDRSLAGRGHRTHCGHGEQVARPFGAHQRRRRTHESTTWPRVQLQRVRKRARRGNGVAVTKLNRLVGASSLPW